MHFETQRKWVINVFNGISSSFLLIFTLLIKALCRRAQFAIKKSMRIKWHSSTTSTLILRTEGTIQHLQRGQTTTTSNF